jgi:hypothetical protein
MINYYGIFAQSKPTSEWVNSFDNGLVFCELGTKDSIKVKYCISSKIDPGAYFFQLISGGGLFYKGPILRRTNLRRNTLN